MRTAARHCNVDAIRSDHGRSAEPEHGDDADAGSNSIPAARHGVAVTDRELDAHERPRDGGAARARSVLRR